MIILPFAVFGILAYLLVHRGDGFRSAALRSAALTTVYLVGSTELLSIPCLLTRTALILSWLAALAFVVALWARRAKTARCLGASAQRPLARLSSRLTPKELVLAGIIALSVTCVAVVAFVAPPNSWDAMEHHLPRMMFWVSNHGVGVYPTPDFAQLLKAPGAEFVALHLYLLNGSDRFVNLVEFFSFVGCGIGASLIASKLGASVVGQLIAGLFAVTIPEAILEASGAMTTAVASFWAVTACYFIVEAGDTFDEWDVISAALATGMALLTEPVSFHGLPVVLSACVLFRPSTTRLWFVKRLPVFLVVALAVNAGQFVRAYEVTGNVLGSPFPEGGPRLNFSNERLTPPAIAASVLRQASLQMGTPSNKVNAYLEGAVRRAIGMMGEDPDDPGASWSGFPFFIDRPTRLETQAGNPVHFLLVILCLSSIAVWRSKNTDKRLLWYSGGLVAAFIVFSACVRWQPWGSRFDLPLFVLSAAVIGVVAERLLRPTWMVTTFAMFLLLIAAPYLLSNSIRSIVATKDFPTIFQPRSELYFGDQHEALAPAYLAMARTIRARNCGRVAIDAYLPVPEPLIKMSPRAYFVYPLLAQLAIDGQESTVRYIGVNNTTKKFGDHAGLGPTGNADCAIVCLTCRLSNGIKSDAALGEMQLFGDSELVFPAH